MTAVVSRWVRLGGMFNVPPATGPVDLERLLVDTARLAPANTRLLTMGSSWLARHGAAVDDGRLAGMVCGLSAGESAVLGLMLDLAREAADGDSARAGWFARALT